MITLKEVIIMDIKYLQENQQQLFQQMKDAGYATDYIYRFQVLVQYILDNNEHSSSSSLTIQPASVPNATSKVRARTRIRLALVDLVLPLDVVFLISVFPPLYRYRCHSA